MNKITYAYKIMQLQKEYPNELCQNGIWKIEDFDYLNFFDVRKLYQVQLKVLYEKRPDLRGN